MKMSKTSFRRGLPFHLNNFDTIHHHEVNSSFRFIL